MHVTTIIFTIEQPENVFEATFGVNYIFSHSNAKITAVIYNVAVTNIIAEFI